MLRHVATKYVVTGFPRTLNQAIAFETAVCEFQLVLNLVCDEALSRQRLQKRADMLERPVESGDLIKQRLEEYTSKTVPALEYYAQVGKVRDVDSKGTIGDVYQLVLRAVMPQTYFIVGPRASGKSAVSAYLAERTNMQHLDFAVFAGKKEFAGIRGSPDLITRELIKELHNVNRPRAMVEGFPENGKQLLYFLANAVSPEGVILLQASESCCLAHNNQLASHPSYTAPAVLCKQMRDFYANIKEVAELCKKRKILLELRNEEGCSLGSLLKSAGKLFDPEVLLVRSEEGAQESMIGMLNEMAERFGYRQLNVPMLRREEITRKTAAGREMIQFTSAGKIIPSEITIKFLKRILYSPSGHKKFILTGFPEETGQLSLLESTCCNIVKEFFFYPPEGEKVLNSSVASIETYMHEDHRLIPVQNFDSEQIERYYGLHLQYAFVMGAPLSGKTTVAKRIEKAGFTMLEANAMTEEMKKKLETEQTPAESITITPEQLLAELKNRTVNRADKKERFVLDGFPVDSADAIDKLFAAVGPPAYYIELHCDAPVLKERHKKKNELQELAEEQNAELDKTYANFAAIMQGLAKLQENPHVAFCPVSTAQAEDLTVRDLRGIFEPKLVLLKHDSNINVDVILTNLSIKYDFLYINVTGLIKREIESGNTEMGTRLAKTRKLRELVEEHKADEDWRFCAVHYDRLAVIQLVKDSIRRLRVQQEFILIDGLVNAHKLKNLADRLEVRAMDELFAIDKEIGEVRAILSLTRGEYEKVEDDRVIVKPPPPPEKPVPVPAADKPGDKSEDKQEPPPPEKSTDEEGKICCDPPTIGKPLKPPFKPEEYSWTNTEDKPRTLGQFFAMWKKCATKNMMSNEILPEGANTEVVLDSLLATVIGGELSKSPVYVQVKFSA